MYGYTDVHDHILYGVDDGAIDLNQSLELINDEYNQGVRRVILTPHFRIGMFETDKETIDRHFLVLREKVKEKYTDFELYQGNEIFYSDSVISLLNQRKIRPLADSRYALIEFMPGDSFGKIEKSLRTVLLNGYTPIVAHCERYDSLYGNTGKLFNLVENGVYLQVNAGSFEIRRFRKFIKKLIDNDCLHFIGSDAHNRSDRGVHFDKCVQYLEKHYGSDYVDWLLIENPDKVIRNQFI